jgi:hypothetical protein
MRYNECGCNNKKKKKESEREMTKPGNYTSKDLEKTKKTPWRK